MASQVRNVSAASRRYSSWFTSALRTDAVIWSGVLSDCKGEGPDPVRVPGGADECA